jgi:hypothetical protein
MKAHTMIASALLLGMAGTARAQVEWGASPAEMLESARMEARTAPSGVSASAISGKSAEKANAIFHDAAPGWGGEEKAILTAAAVLSGKPIADVNAVFDDAAKGWGGQTKAILAAAAVISGMPEDALTRKFFSFLFGKR